jgi:hypothetical protein
MLSNKARWHTRVYHCIFIKFRYFGNLVGGTEIKPDLKLTEKKFVNSKVEEQQRCLYCEVLQHNIVKGKSVLYVLYPKTKYVVYFPAKCVIHF